MSLKSKPIISSPLAWMSTTAWRLRLSLFYCGISFRLPQSIVTFFYCGWTSRDNLCLPHYNECDVAQCTLGYSHWNSTCVHLSNSIRTNWLSEKFTSGSEQFIGLSVCALHQMPCLIIRTMLITDDNFLNGSYYKLGQRSFTWSSAISMCKGISTNRMKCIQYTCI